MVVLCPTQEPNHIFYWDYNQLKTPSGWSHAFVVSSEGSPNHRLRVKDHMKQVHMKVQVNVQVNLDFHVNLQVDLQVNLHFQVKVLLNLQLKVHRKVHKGWGP